MYFDNRSKDSLFISSKRTVLCIFDSIIFFQQLLTIPYSQFLFVYYYYFFWKYCFCNKIFRIYFSIFQLFCFEFYSIYIYLSWFGFRYEFKTVSQHKDPFLTLCICYYCILFESSASLDILGEISIYLLFPISYSSKLSNLSYGTPFLY